MNSINQITKQYHLLSTWYISVLDEIKLEDGKKLIQGQANSLEWLAGHLIVGRYRNLIRLGSQPEPYAHLDKFVNQTIPPPNAIAFDALIAYPDLDMCKSQWLIYTDLLHQTLKNVSEKTLSTEIPFTVLTGGNTVEDALAFMVMHETYHIGQMSIIRKALGYPSMKLNAK